MILSPPQGLYRRSWGPPGAPPRRGLPPRASGLPEGPTTGTANADVLARIKAARQYKDSQSKPVVQQPQSIGAAAGVGSAAPLLGMPETKPEEGSQGGGSSAADAVLARIKKAKEYKQQPASPAAAAAAAPEQQQQQLGGGIEQVSSVPTLPEQQQPIGGQAGNTQQAAGWLQSVVAKDQPQLDPSMSPEMFTRMREEQMKRQGGEVIVGTFQPVNRQDRMMPPTELRQPADGPADAAGSEATAFAAELSAAEAGTAEQQGQQEQQQQGATVHKPKVATWGVFPRPQNISEAYGGGRNLRPGQALESKEQAQVREQRVSAALQKYRKSLGLDVDPRDEAQAAALCEEGNALFKQGAISLALDKYAAAAELMPTRNRVGGEARLQQAICLDSLGKNNEAYEIYKQITRHPTPAVAKQASRMLFGFQAAENLKVSTISYAPPSQAWKNYFDRISRGSWNATIYSPPSSSSELDLEGGVSEAWAAVLAVSVMLAPLGLVVYRIVMQRYQ